jgi:SAM-dependent MidA family methyltransferase
MADVIPWRAATEQALYGESGFYRRHRPAAHFRTSVHASPLLATALLSLVHDTGLGTVVDVGAGGGELLVELHRQAPELELLGVDVAARPPGLPPAVRWAAEPPDSVTGLLVAHELLDDVPVDVVQRDRGAWRVVLVDPATGGEQLGDEVPAADAAWLGAWWPDGDDGDRAEVGRPRDAVWAGLVGSIDRGIAVAVDYAHERGARPRAGTLTGYRDGRQVRPVPDGSCDVTSHVALDACAAAGVRAGATSTALTTQRAALLALGLAADRPPHSLASSDPAAYLQALSRRGELAELTDRDGLGGFGWLVQAVGVDLPPGLAASSTGTACSSASAARCP